MHVENARPWCWRWTMQNECDRRGLTPLEFAVEVYYDRQKKHRKDRRWIPKGVSVKNPFKERPNVWYPVPSEVRPCCVDITPASYKYPYVHQRHCRSARHIAMLFNVDERDLVGIISGRKNQNRCARCRRFIASDLEKCGPCMYLERVDSEE